MALNSNDMAALMEEELRTIYPDFKGIPLPETGREDRRMMFLAIARGILRHLQQEVDDTLADITFENGSPVKKNVSEITLNITIPGV